MQNNCQNILKCVDILSVALAIGLAMEDAPRNSSTSEGGEGSDSGEEAAEGGGVQGEDSEDELETGETEGKEEEDEENEEEEGKGKGQLEDEREKTGLSVAPAPSPSSPPTPGPERCDHVFVPTVSVTEKKTWGRNREGKETATEEEMKEEIKVVDEQVEYERSPTLRVMRNGNTDSMRKMPKGKLIDGGNESENDKVDQKGASEDRGSGYERDVREVGMGDQGITEAEFVKQVQDSLVQAPSLTRSDHEKKGLHSSSARELESAAAIRDAKQAHSASRSPRSEKRELRSNIQRELVGAGSSAVARIDFDGPYAQETHPRYVPHAPEPRHSGLHSNTQRELEAAGTAKEVDIEFRGPSAQSSRAQPPSFRNKIHSNPARELEAAASGSADALLPTKGGLHSNTERELESEGVAREAFRRRSQRSLIGTSVVATLEIVPAHYVSTGSEPAEAEKPRHQQERRLPQRELDSSRYAEEANSYPGSSTDADRPSGGQKGEKRLSQRELVGMSYAKKANSVPESSKDASTSPSGRQTRKLSQNDLLGLAHAALSDIVGSNGAGPSHAPQAVSLYHKNNAPESSPPSLGGRQASSHDDSIDGLRRDKQDMKTQMDAESSTDNATANENFGSQYTSPGYSSDSGQHRYAAQRDLKNSRRYHPYEQATASAEENSSEVELEEEAGDGLGSSAAHSQPSSETPSGFFARLRSPDPTPDPDPNPDPEDDQDSEGFPEPMPEDDTGSYPPPPRPDEGDTNNPHIDRDGSSIPIDDVDSYILVPPPPPGDDDAYRSSPQPIPNLHNYLHSYNPDSQYFSYPTIPPPNMLPWPWNPPNGDYLAPFQPDTSHLSSIQAPQHRVDHPYLRVRHPGDRMLCRRPRCGLLIVTDMRRDKSLPVERRRGNRIPRTPGRVDITFLPRVGDIILRHVRLPGQGAVEIWYPGLQTEEGDSLIRFKLDPFSYDSGSRESSNLLIVEAKGYISFEKMWIYMGSATHSVIKAEQRVLGIGARDGRTIYAK